MHIKDGERLMLHRMTWYTVLCEKTAMGLLLLQVNPMVKCFIDKCGPWIQWL
jgi:hypothetical protein